MEKIQSLTKEQEMKLPIYTKMGIDIGIATGPEMDEEKVREITDAHRVMCDLNKAKVFKVYDSPFAAIADNKSLKHSNALYGQHDINWLIFYLFFRVEFGLTQETEKIVHLLELSKRCGWMWMNSETTVVTRRPKFIHTITVKEQRNDSENINELKVLHNPDGLALEYADGTGVYALYGTRIPKEYTWLVTNKGNYGIEDILKIKNSAIKTIGLRLLGPSALITTGTAVDKWSSKTGGKYVLYSVEVNGNNRLYLSGKCPSKNEPFCEAVPPTIKTCQEALAWREEEVDLSYYLEPSIRT
jgi:hypothetical protein